jgi:hypothetical protein
MLHLPHTPVRPPPRQPHPPSAHLLCTRCIRPTHIRYAGTRPPAMHFTHRTAPAPAPDASTGTCTRPPSPAHMYTRPCTIYTALIPGSNWWWVEAVCRMRRAGAAGGRTPWECDQPTTSVLAPPALSPLRIRHQHHAAVCRQLVAYRPQIRVAAAVAVVQSCSVARGVQWNICSPKISLEATLFERN